MTTEVFIDLDRDGDRARVEAPRPVRRPSRRQIRAAVLAGIALLLAFLPTLSLRPRPLITQLGVFPKPAIGYQNLLLVGDTAIAIADGAVTAFEFDGTRRWSYRSEDPVDYMFVEDAPRHGAFLLATMLLSPGDGRRQQLTVERVVALDRQTGRPRWQIDGSAQPVGDLIVSFGAKTLRVYQGNPPALRWQASGFASHAIDPGDRRAWTIADDGTLAERDLDTGEVLRHRRIDVTGNLAVLGGRVFVMSDDPGDTVTAYDTATLERVEWAANWFPSSACGPVICVTTRSDRLPTMGGVDRQTGRLLWTMPAEQFVYPGNAGPLAVRPGSSSMIPVAGLIDPLTGQIRVPLTGWNVINPAKGILVGPGQGRLHVARLEAGGPRLLGSVPHQSTSCTTKDGEVLMCDLSDGRVGVWRLAP